MLEFVGRILNTDPLTIEYPAGYKQGLEKLAPVSYTHLRAHETVLDLVCRLLLEKKNITNKDNENITQKNHNEHRSRVNLANNKEV